MPSSVPGYCFGSVVFISVHPERGGVSGARWELSLCVCVHLGSWAQPPTLLCWLSPSLSENKHLQAGDGGVCAVTTTVAVADGRAFYNWSKCSSLYMRAERSKARGKYPKT